MKYAKLAAQVLAAAFAAVAAAVAGDNHIEASEAVNVLIVTLGAVAVLGAGNLPAGVWRYTKVIVSAATAVAVLLQSVITGGVSTAEWWQLAIAAVGALGVHLAPGPVVFTPEQAGAAANLRPGPN